MDFRPGDIRPLTIVGVIIVVMAIFFVLRGYLSGSSPVNRDPPNRGEQTTAENGSSSVPQTR